ncbi:hypothetical protein H6G82_26735 [Planktothricoides sp. FACHB-1261]|nr:hypothetical protein [Planktothricoides raciborskii FACHB-1261]
MIISYQRRSHHGDMWRLEWATRNRVSIKIFVTKAKIILRNPVSQQKRSLIIDYDKSSEAIGEF